MSLGRVWIENGIAMATGKVKVKICGMTNWTDARRAVHEGADFLGFNFYARSPRYIAPAKARRIVRRLPKGIHAVGVFVNETEQRMLEIGARRGARLCAIARRRAGGGNRAAETIAAGHRNHQGGAREEAVPRGATRAIQAGRERCCSMATTTGGMAARARHSIGRPRGARNRTEKYFWRAA